MTATADFLVAKAPDPQPVRMVDGRRMVVRGLQRLLGTAMALAAAGLWLAPGALWESDVMLFKLILSLIGLLAAFGLIQASATPPQPEIQIDTVRRELRLVRPDGEVLQRCTFADLSRAEQTGTNLRLWDAAGILLAEVALSDRAALRSLVAGLRDAGKLD